MRENPTQISRESQEEPDGSSFFVTETYSLRNNLPEAVRRIGSIAANYPGQFSVEIKPADLREEKSLGSVAVSFPRDKA